MHLEMSAFKSSAQLLDSNPSSAVFGSVQHIFQNSLPYSNEGFSPMYPLDQLNITIHDEHENRNIFSLENESYLKKHYNKREPNLNRFHSDDVKQERISYEDEVLEKSRLENFQDVFFVPPPFAPFSSPPSSVLSSLPALSPDEDIPNLNDLFSNKECDLESDLSNLPSDLQNYHNDYLGDVKVRNGNLFMPIHNPPVMPNMSNPSSGEQEINNPQYTLTLPEGFNTNVLHIPDHHQVDDFHSLLTQIEDANNPNNINNISNINEAFDQKQPGLPRFSRSLFSNSPKNNFTHVNFQQQHEGVVLKSEEFVPVLNFKTEYSASEDQSNGYATNSNRIFESEVKVHELSRNLGDDSSIHFSEFRTLGDIFDNQDLRGKIVRRGRRRGVYESDVGSLQCELALPEGRGSKRGAKAASLSR